MPSSSQRLNWAVIRSGVFHATPCRSCGKGACWRTWGWFRQSGGKCRAFRTAPSASARWIAGPARYCARVPHQAPGRRLAAPPEAPAGRLHSPRRRTPRPALRFSPENSACSARPSGSILVFHAWFPSILSSRVDRAGILPVKWQNRIGKIAHATTSARSENELHPALNQPRATALGRNLPEARAGRRRVGTAKPSRFPPPATTGSPPVCAALGSNVSTLRL